MERVECIVVGGGLAGLSAAYGMAMAGVEVLVLERGDYSGAKNVTGGRMYVSSLRGIYPELWSEAPFERPVAREVVTLVGKDEQTTVETASDRFLKTEPQSYTVVRAKLDRWLADRVSEQGAMVLTKMKADALLKDGTGRVTGIRAGDDEIGADAIIIAEGVLGLLGTEARLRPRPDPLHHALGYKEILELSPSTIEDRWHLNPGEGAAHLFAGTLTRGMTGGGFIYTNRESISLGIVVSIEQMARRTDGLESWQLLDDFKELPQIRPLLAGSTLVEYSAHAIAEGGIAQVPRLWGDGYVMVGDAAGLSLNALLTVRGMDFAVASGYYAAQTVVAAKKQKDFSGASLSTYEQRMRQSFVLRDLLSSKGIPQALENERLVTHYPGALANLLSGLYTIGPGPDVKLSRKVAAAARRHFLDPATLKDLWSLRKL